MHDFFFFFFLSPCKRLLLDMRGSTITSPNLQGARLRLRRISNHDRGLKYTSLFGINSHKVFKGIALKKSFYLFLELEDSLI
ncbi:hypothetical protein Cni_G27569 [Canna indica]|uniref:Uncharacterized protein n=1 Tax=Canna indica TaxID=4628 RepID=A0AAQ3L415_9LILI|nr:hypothetical protein Cni_G27569 [Canna indica]